LDYLNSIHWSSEIPDELKNLYDKEKYRKAQEYDKVNTRFSFVTSTISVVAMLLILFFGGFAWLDDFVR